MLDKEFARCSRNQGLVNRYNSLSGDQKIQESANAPPVPSTENRPGKNGRIPISGAQIKRKQEDGKVRVEKRQQEIMGPVLADISKGNG
jgi:hypothetical protein